MKKLLLLIFSILSLTGMSQSIHPEACDEEYQLTIDALNSTHYVYFPVFAQDTSLTSSEYLNPSGFIRTPNGDVYVSGHNLHVIREYTSTGTCTKVSSGFSGFARRNHSTGEWDALPTFINGNPVAPLVLYSFGGRIFGFTSGFGFREFIAQTNSWGPMIIPEAPMPYLVKLSDSTFMMSFGSAYTNPSFNKLKVFNINTFLVTDIPGTNLPGELRIGSYFQNKVWGDTIPITYTELLPSTIFYIKNVGLQSMSQVFSNNFSSISYFWGEMFTGQQGCFISPIGTFIFETTTFRVLVYEWNYATKVWDSLSADPKGLTAAGYDSIAKKYFVCGTLMIDSSGKRYMMGKNSLMPNFYENGIPYFGFSRLRDQTPPVFEVSIPQSVSSADTMNFQITPQRGHTLEISENGSIILSRMMDDTDPCSGIIWKRFIPSGYTDLKFKMTDQEGNSSDTTISIHIPYPVGTNDLITIDNQVFAFGNTLNVNMPSTDIIIYNTSGKIVFQKKGNFNSFQTNVNLATGIYIVKVTTEDGSIVTRKLFF